MKKAILILIISAGIISIFSTDYTKNYYISIFSTNYMKNYYEADFYPKTEISITNKIIWNDITVKYDIEKVRESHAQTIFKALFEKYGEKLKAVNITRPKEIYHITMDLDNESINEYAWTMNGKVKFIDKYKYRH